MPITSVAKRLFISNSTVPEEFSQAVSMQGANAAQMDATVFYTSSGGKAIIGHLQISNDLENWEDIGGYADTNLYLGYTQGNLITGIGAAYVRLRYTSDFAGLDSILAAGINLSHQ